MTDIELFYNKNSDLGGAKAAANELNKLQQLRQGSMDMHEIDCTSDVNPYKIMIPEL